MPSASLNVHHARIPGARESETSVEMAPNFVKPSRSRPHRLRMSTEPARWLRRGGPGLGVAARSWAWYRVSWINTPSQERWNIRRRGDEGPGNIDADCQWCGVI